MRGGLFDRIQLIQGDNAVRWTDKQHRRLRILATADAPSFTELDQFKIPADSGFDPAAPFRIQLLAQRVVGAVEKTFLTFDLGYALPKRYLLPVATAPPPIVTDLSAETAAKAALWQRIWRDRTIEIGILCAMLLTLTGIFFQFHATANPRTFCWVRVSFLTVSSFY